MVDKENLEGVIILPAHLTMERKWLQFSESGATEKEESGATVPKNVVRANRTTTTSITFFNLLITSLVSKGLDFFNRSSVYLYLYIKIPSLDF